MSPQELGDQQVPRGLAVSTGPEGSREWDPRAERGHLFKWLHCVGRSRTDEVRLSNNLVKTSNLLMETNMKFNFKHGKFK